MISNFDQFKQLYPDAVLFSINENAPILDIDIKQTYERIMGKVIDISRESGKTWVVCSNFYYKQLAQEGGQV